MTIELKSGSRNRTGELAAFIAGISVSSIPKPVVEATHRFVLDDSGALLATKNGSIG